MVKAPASAEDYLNDYCCVPSDSFLADQVVNRRNWGPIPPPISGVCTEDAGEEFTTFCYSRSPL